MADDVSTPAPYSLKVHQYASAPEHQRARSRLVGMGWLFLQLLPLVSNKHMISRRRRRSPFWGRKWRAAAALGGLRRARGQAHAPGTRRAGAGRWFRAACAGFGRVRARTRAPHPPQAATGATLGGLLGRFRRLTTFLMILPRHQALAGISTQNSEMGWIHSFPKRQKK